ncbi:MAG: ABC transporter ATP-binding protein [Candidatus Aminicenantes bacterium]|nr:ABC transporter ATP-binding protein [Candidatus Aminicenantes bacterium]
MGTRFRLVSVRKAYGDRRQLVAALGGVDLEIKDGQVNALVGRSGAGKSTLARILMGFERPDDGAVLYRGRPLDEAARPDFRRCNQMVFQNPFLAVNPLFSVQRIISEPLRLNGVPTAAGMDAIIAVMELLEIPAGLLRRRPHELSGGELQRVALARALVLEPEFLVLDEPFSALDDLTSMRILRQFRGIVRRLGLGTLFISHHPRHVAALADRVAVLEKGRIVG